MYRTSSMLDGSSYSSRILRTYNQLVSNCEQFLYTDSLRIHL